MSYKYKTCMHILKSGNLISESLLDANIKNIMTIFEDLDCQVDIVDVNQMKNYDFGFVFISGGGTEPEFLKNLQSYKPPIYLIAIDNNNALGAAMEILSYLKNNDISGQIIHGSKHETKSQIARILKIQKTMTEIKDLKFARIGKPCDWLISSDVDNVLSGKQGIEIIDISMQELEDQIKQARYDQDEWTEKIEALEFDQAEKTKALNIYGALKRITDQYQLDGLTLRCFDLVNSTHSTSCVALSLLNAQNIYAACEGDMPSLISMCLIHKLTGQTPFMANPSKIDVTNNNIIFAHCSVPLNMSDNYRLDTHYESGIGVAIKSELELGDATVFKASGLLDKFFVSPAKILRNLDQHDLCRTQIKMHMYKDVNYFLQDPIGNHHIIINKDYSSLIREFMQTLNKDISLQMVYWQ